MLACYVTDDDLAIKNPSLYFARHAVKRSDLGNTPWVLLSSDRYRIKQAVEAQGVPLKKWDILINYGIKTGYNDAFYITTEQRNEFIAEDPRSADLIVPLLRGRYIDRYATSWDESVDAKWMISTFPSLNLKYSTLPRPIRDYLSRHRISLEPKPSDWLGTKWPGRKAGSYEWFETQDAIAYWAEFQKPKIIYPNMTKYLPFYLDKVEHFYGNQKCFIVTSESESLEYLTALLNSTIFRCCFKDNFPELLGNTYELSKIFMEKIPVKKPDSKQINLFDAMVPIVQAAKALSGKSSDYQLAADFLVDVIDACVMEVYFPQHMAEKDLCISEQVLNLLPSNISSLQPEALGQTALAFYQMANDSKHSIRSKLLRISIDSPELLGVIQREGAV